MSDNFDKLLNNNLDVSENAIWESYPHILDILLIDRSSKKNIKWCTDDYSKYGKLYEQSEQIKAKLITGKYKNIIKPRVIKSVDEQKRRIKDKAEVFTPSWICNNQNNLIDKIWFGADDVFNKPNEFSWVTSKRVIFPKNKTFIDYINEDRIEITCGEAPYLCSRYDTTTGQYIKTHDRVGILDRKLRVVSENTNLKGEWVKLAKECYKSTYGYDYQGDNVLIARENLLITYIDFYRDKFSEDPKIEELENIAEIISWNIWQMDGIKFVIPESCHKDSNNQLSLFQDDILEDTECIGCQKNNIFKHNGIYCKIKDWKLNKEIRYVDLFKGKINGTI